MAYWYDVENDKVIESHRGMFHGKLMGPYDSEDEARRALQIAAERTREWDAREAAWDDED